MKITSIVNCCTQYLDNEKAVFCKYTDEHLGTIFGENPKETVV